MSQFNKRPDNSSGSFLPEDYLRRKAEARSVVISTILFCIVTMGVVGAFFVTNRQWTSVKERQEEINREYATETKKIEQLKILEAQKAEMMDKAEVTTALIEKAPRSILLAELINRMPKELTLTELNLKSKRIVEAPPKKDPKQTGGAKARSLAGPKTNAAADAKAAKAIADAVPKKMPPKFDFKLEMIGLASTDEEIADYHQSLNECPLLDKVEMLYTGDVKIDDIHMRKFRIEAALRPGADARKIEPLHIPRLPPRPGFGRAIEQDPMDPTLPRAGADQE